MDAYSDDESGPSTLNLYWTAHVVGGEEHPDDDVAELRWYEPEGFPANVALRWHYGLLRSGRGIELVDVRDVRPWNQMAGDAHRDLDRKNTMSEILRDRI